MKLISNTSFGELCKSKEKSFLTRLEYLEWYEKVRNNFDNFLKQPSKLEMFVPCYFRDGIAIPYTNETTISSIELFNEYEQAKEKVLFQGFEIVINKEGEKVILGDYTCLKVSNLENLDIEYLVKYVHIKLTPNAIKQLGL